MQDRKKVELLSAAPKATLTTLACFAGPYQWSKRNGVLGEWRSDGI